MIKTGELYIKFNKHLPYIYLLYAIPMVCIALALTPPFQNPDEPNHFARAEQVSRLEYVPVFVPAKTPNDTIVGIPKMFYPNNGGFDADKGIFDVYNVYSYMCFNPQVKITQAKCDSTKNIKWGKGKSYINFGNTAIYPPISYLMPATGVMLGKWLHLSVTTTLYLSRSLNAFLAVVLCFLALKLAKRSNLLLITVLLFPMTIALFASINPDAMLISCSFLLIAIIDNVEFDEAKTYNNKQILALIVLMCIIAVAKPPYIILAFVFFFLKLSKKIKFVSITVPLLAVLSWLVINHANFLIRSAPAEMRVNSKMQMVNIIHHPFQYIALFFKVDIKSVINISHMFVGVLGWLDAPFPGIYYCIAYAILITGFAIQFKPGKQNGSLLKIGLLSAAFFTLISILTAQYVTWTPLGAHELGAMQGRYLLPIFPFVALALSGSFNEIKLSPFKNILFGLILVFPVYTCANIIVVLINRYYN